MRNSLYVLMALCLSFAYAMAQSSAEPKKPINLVEQAKISATPFTTYTPVKKSSNQATNAAFRNETSDYTLLDIDKAELNQMTLQADEAILLRIPTETFGILELELVQVDLTSDLVIKESLTMQEATIELEGVYYRGIIKDQPQSLVAVSVFNNEITGIISSPDFGNLVLGKLKNADASGQHVIYNDQEVMQSHDLGCETPDDDPHYTREQLEHSIHNGRSSLNCVKVYLEVDQDIFLDFGSVANTVNYITVLFNEVATLYANDGVTVKISEIFVWNTASPYNGSSSSQMLTQFQNEINSFNGNLGMLLSYQASGGIAVLDGLCHPLVDARLCFASINSNFQQVPTYSWSVMVMTHELGHLMGSRHTHACVWNGNNTAIDGCAGFTEGNCSLPPSPVGGGTIMSYCHITPFGIDFTQGLGPQPASVINSMVDNASCLESCAIPTCDDGVQNGQETGVDCGGPDCQPCETMADCENNTLIMTILLDDYSLETSWEITTEDGTVVEAFGPYDKDQRGELIRDTFCLEDGCYSFTILDSYGDGICCEYGNGYYQLHDADGNLMKEGGEFESEDRFDFCLPENYDNNNDDCLEINFLEMGVVSFGGAQDAGDYEILDDGRMLRIANNAWKAVPLQYTVTPNTVIEFEFASTIIGEIHGLGFDDNNSISSSKTFKVHGTQNWGIDDFDTYQGQGQWESFVVPIGDYYTGDYVYLFFVADHDAGGQNGNAIFRNVRIYEGAPCNSTTEEEDGELVYADEASMTIFPNPTTDQLNVQVKGMEFGRVVAEVYNMMGQRVMSRPMNIIQGIEQDVLNVSNLTQGSYILRVHDGTNEKVEKFTVTR